jgi:stress response protein YsnF
MSEPERRVVPLEARLERRGDATVIRIPLRVEELRLEKESFVAERVGVRRAARREVEAATATIAREELAVERSDRVEETRRLDTTDPSAVEGRPQTDPPRWAHRLDDP